MKHGHSRQGKTTRTYAIWAGMVARCTSEANPGYHLYAGRGIGVCEEWKDFRNFLKDMGECPAGLTIDRIDGSKGYESGNCRWATRLQQARNRHNVILVNFNGEKRKMCEVADELGIPRKRVADRIKRGWPDEDLFIPEKRYYRRKNPGNSKIVCAGGESKNLLEWSKEIGCKPGTIYARIWRGMTPEEAVSKPARKVKQQTYVA